MRKSRILIYCFFISLTELYGLTENKGQIVPVQAKVIRTSSDVRQGGTSVKTIHRDIYIRNSQGSVYQKMERIDPSSGSISGTRIIISSVPDGVQYVVNEDEKTITIGTNKTKHITDDLPAAFPRKVYKGRSVVVVPIMGTGRTEPIGEAWTDEATKIILHRQTMIKGPTVTIEETWETEEFITGVEPNPGLFKLSPESAGYKVIDRRK